MGNNVWSVQGHQRDEASVLFASHLGMAGLGSVSDPQRRGAVHVAGPGVLSSVGDTVLSETCAGYSISGVPLTWVQP